MICQKFHAILFLLAASIQISASETISPDSQDAQALSGRSESSLNDIPQRTRFDPSSCPPGTYPAADKCWLLGSNCLTYDSLGKCLSCRAGMKVANGRCVPAANRVKTCLQGTPNNCTLCAENTSSPRPGYCQQIEPNCKRFNGDGICVVCKGSLVLDRGFCLTHLPEVFAYADENCSVWSNGICMQCAKGWSITSSGQPCVEELKTVQSSTASQSTIN